MHVHVHVIISVNINKIIQKHVHVHVNLCSGTTLLWNHWDRYCTSGLIKEVHVLISECPD